MLPPTWKWSDLPDPRDPHAPHGACCTVVAPARALEHIREKHVCDRREPWKEWLSADLLQRLRHMDGAGADALQASAALEGFARYLGEAAGECLRRPLALLYEVTERVHQGVKPAMVWLLVLRSGALLVIRVYRDKPYVATCFYPYVACIAAKPQQRWRKVVASLVARFADLRARRPHPPQASDTKVIAPGRKAAQIRFVTPTSWGFDLRLAGAPWCGHLEAWPGAATQPVPPRHRLHPRRVIEEHCDDASSEQAG